MYLKSLVLCLAALPLALHAQGTSDDNPLPAPAPDEPITTTYTTATAAASRPSSTLDGPATTTYVTATAARPESLSTPDEPVITTYVTATGPPPASATAAPTQTVCSLGVKICEGCEDPNLFCIQFDVTGYETEKDLACSQVYWGDYHKKMEMECGERWDPYRNEKPPDVPGTNWACDINDCGGDVQDSWTAYDGPMLGYGRHPKIAATEAATLKRR
ncbi:MAG: hypothetical protein LQ337_003619 [Flavoplaca oasis]|nr:MAG: hypothetical protein LQ337_003619 [Flavoplaca oasis]